MQVASRIPLADRTRGGTRQVVYGALLDAVVTGTLQPGRRLSENELAELFGVSRTPIREALFRLRDDRLVEIVPQLGTFVSKISVDAVADAQFVREALECAAIRLAAERVEDPDLEALNANVDEQILACRDGDDARFYSLDDRFHSTLCQVAGKPIAWFVAQRADGHLNRVRRLSLPVPEYMGEMIEEHQAVIDALAARDPDAAETALRHHLRMVLSGLQKIKDERPDYFEESDV